MLDRPQIALERKSRIGVWQALAWRGGIAFALICVAIAGHWFDRDGLRDNVDDSISFADVVYFTMITITTVGYGDITPVTVSARMFDAFVVTPIRLFVWLIFLGTAYDFVFKRVWEKWRMQTIQANLRDHIVVAGCGTSGSEAVAELIARGIDPASIVVIDRDENLLAPAKDRGVTVVNADATRNATLEAVHIARAKSIIVSAGRDDTSILIVLTARRLANDVPISVVIRAQDNEMLARQAGATTVINPASFAGLLLAGSTEGPNVAEYVTDLAASNGRVALRERCATPDEVGRPLSDVATGMGVRVLRRGECIGFWEPASRSLEADDVIVEIVPAD